MESMSYRFLRVYIFKLLLSTCVELWNSKTSEYHRLDGCVLPRSSQFITEPSPHIPVAG